MHYRQRSVSELYPIKDVLLVIALIAIVIPIGISVAALLTGAK